MFFEQFIGIYWDLILSIKQLYYLKGFQYHHDSNIQQFAKVRKLLKSISYWLAICLEELKGIQLFLEDRC